MQNEYLNFDEYIRQGEPNKKAKAAIWRTAIGLQAVDGLQTWFSLISINSPIFLYVPKNPFLP